MKLFITGGSGALGRALVPVLLKQGHDLCLLYHKSGVQFRHPRVKTIRGDLRQPSGYATRLPEADAVIHLAACIRSHRVSDYFSVNTTATAGLVSVAEKAGVRRLIYISTCAVGKACGAYGESKRQAEIEIEKSGLSWTILRPSEVYGSGDADTVSRTIRGVIRYPVVPVPGRGTQRLAPVHVGDVVAAIGRSLSAPETIHGIYTLAGPRVMTYREMITCICRCLGLRRVVIPIPLGLVQLSALGTSILAGDSLLLTRDQVPRLLCDKAWDISAARRDLDFRPAPLSDHISP